MQQAKSRRQEPTELYATSDVKQKQHLQHDSQPECRKSQLQVLFTNRLRMLFSERGWIPPYLSFESPSSHSNIDFSSANPSFMSLFTGHPIFFAGCSSVNKSTTDISEKTHLKTTALTFANIYGHMNKIYTQHPFSPSPGLQIGGLAAR